MSLQNLTIPKGDLILVTGASGYIGSHVADQTLEAGYRVRGVVRDSDRANWLQDHFDQKYGVGNFELKSLADYGNEPAVAAVVKGVAGIAHVATVTDLSPVPEPYISQVTAIAVNLLKAAAKEASVKSFVLTSSSLAAFNPIPNTEFTVTPDSYNEEAAKAAFKEPFDPPKAWTVYSASKVIAEKDCWRFVKENNPGFVFNTVLPNANFGPALSQEHQGFPSTGGWPKMFLDGNFEMIQGVPPQHFIDVQDNARLHLIALTNPSVKNERLFGFAAPYNWNDILAILRELYPDKKIVDDIPDIGKDLSHPPSERAEALLKEFGQPGWTTLKDSISRTFANIQ